MADEPADDNSEMMAQSSIDELLKMAGAATPPNEDVSKPLSAPQDNVELDLAMAQSSIDELLKQANFEDPSSITAPEMQLPTQAFDLPDFQQGGSGGSGASIELLRDVDLNVKIELGRSRMLVEDVLKLGEGSVVELDKLAGDPVDVFVNDRLVARGEVLVLNDNFCVRVNEIMAGVREEGL